MDSTLYQQQTVGGVSKSTMAASGTDSIGSRVLGFPARGRANTVNGGALASTTTTISATTMALLMGTPQTLTAYGTNTAGDRTLPGNDVITWTSSDATVATVVGGVVTAVKSGTCNVKATIDGVDSSNCAVTITAVLTALILTPNTLTFAHTTTGTTTATATDQFTNSMALPDGSVAHSSSAGVATAAIASTTVTVTGVTAGTTNVTITNGGVTSNICAVTTS